MIRPLALAALFLTACAPQSPATLSGPAAAPTAPCADAGGKADPQCTPGTRNPVVVQDTIRCTICVPNWTDKIRPSSRVTNRIEVTQIAAYGLPGGINDYRLDHLIPLSLGGGVVDVTNLHPQLPADAVRKDNDGRRLKRAVCDGTMTLQAAQAEMVRLWTR